MKCAITGNVCSKENNSTGSRPCNTTCIIGLDFFSDKEERKFNYYENGTLEILSFTKLHSIFANDVDIEQKENGTTFDTWLCEMIKMQIYNEVFYENAVENIL